MIRATEGEIYTMKKIFRETVKYCKGQSMDAEEILEDSKWAIIN